MVQRFAFGKQPGLAATGTHTPHGITQCYLPPGRGDFPPLPYPQLVLDLATPKGCKTKLT